MMTHSVSLLIPFNQITIIKSLSDKIQMGPNKYSAESKIKKQTKDASHIIMSKATGKPNDFDKN